MCIIFILFGGNFFPAIIAAFFRGRAYLWTAFVAIYYWGLMQLTLSCWVFFSCANDALSFQAVPPVLHTGGFCNFTDYHIKSINPVLLYYWSIRHRIFLLLRKLAHLSSYKFFILYKKPQFYPLPFLSPRSVSFSWKLPKCCEFCTNEDEPKYFGSALY